MKLSAKDWIKVDLANHLGMDKLTFPQRIQFVEKHNINELMALAEKAEDKYQAIKAVHEITYSRYHGSYRSNYIMGLDACASG